MASETDQMELAAIKAVFREYSEAIAAGGVDRAMSVWAKDATYLPPNSPVPVVGWEAIASRSRPYLAKFDTRNEITSAGTEVRADLAVDWGQWVQTATPKAGGAPTAIRAKYVRVLRRQAGGAWKIWLDIWNRVEP